MKLKYKLAGGSIMIALFLSAALVISGTVIINKIIYQLNSELLQLKIDDAYEKVEEAFSTLNENGLSEVDAYVMMAQEETIAELKKITAGDTGYVYIVDNKDNTMILHPTVKKDTVLDYDFLNEMISSVKGNIFYTYDDTPKFCVYRTFDKWNWLVAISINKSELYTQRGAYLKLVSLITGLVLIVSLSLLYLYLGKILQGLHSTVDMLKEVAQGKGDLTKRLSVDNNDELGELSKWFNAFIANIEKIISTVQRNTAVVTSTSSDLASKAVEIQSASSEQVSHVESTATATSEMSQTIVEIANNASDASDTAKESLEVANTGKVIVEKTVSGMIDLADSVESSAKTIEELGESSKKIGDIVNVINDISDQTNLLALNAAIEAARAGEHGRGFSVVADEVRKLAESTGHATQEISDMIKKIQQDINSSVRNMGKGKEKVDEGVKLSKQAQESLDKIVKVSNECEKMVNEIASSTVQQSSAIDEVSSTIENIAGIAIQSQTGVTEINAATENLARLSDELNALVSLFTVNSEKVHDVYEPENTSVPVAS